MSCHSPDPPGYCSSFSPELKLYQAFIFSVPVFFSFVILLLFYLFYLRRRAGWQSLRMRATNLTRGERLRVCLSLTSYCPMYLISTYFRYSYVFFFFETYSLVFLFSLFFFYHYQPSEIGVTKEMRDMLPVVVFKESFSIRETQ